MPRVALDSDAPEIQQWLLDFGLVTTLAKLRKRWRSRNTNGERSYIAAIEPGLGYAEAHMRISDIKISSIFPEGVDVKLLKPSLAKVLQRAARTRDLNTPVWARFFGGKDENGVPDGGKSKCEAWHALYPKTRIIPPDEPGGLWEIRAVLGELL